MVGVISSWNYPVMLALMPAAAALAAGNRVMVKVSEHAPATGAAVRDLLAEAFPPERVAVVDWDVHHGNGTEHAFYSDPSVLTISIHQDGAFPATSGSVEDRGDGPGRGFPRARHASCSVFI